MKTNVELLMGSKNTTSKPTSSAGQTNLPKGAEWYKCKGCDFEWPNFPGPQECPMCQHLYIEWVSYKEE